MTIAISKNGNDSDFLLRQTIWIVITFVCQLFSIMKYDKWSVFTVCIMIALFIVDWWCKRLRNSWQELVRFTANVWSEYFIEQVDYISFFYCINAVVQQCCWSCWLILLSVSFLLTASSFSQPPSTHCSMVSARYVRLSHLRYHWTYDMELVPKQFAWAGHANWLFSSYTEDVFFDQYSAHWAH